jgi:hypothetical protein
MEVMMIQKNVLRKSIYLLLITILIGLSACQSQSIPPAPVPIEKEKGSGCWNTIDLSWEEVKDPSGVKAYYVQVAYEEKETKGQFEEAAEFGPFHETQYKMPIDCGRVFRWTVRVENDEGISSEWSDWVVDDRGVPPGG